MVCKQIDNVAISIQYCIRIEAKGIKESDRPMLISAFRTNSCWPQRLIPIKASTGHLRSEPSSSFRPKS